MEVWLKSRDSIFWCGLGHETVERDEHGRARFLGYVLQFGEWSLYHSATLTDIREWRKAATFRRDVALLPINGRSPESRVPGNLLGPEAARFAKDIGARLVIPCHFEMFEFNTASPDELSNSAAGTAVQSATLRRKMAQSCVETRPTTGTRDQAPNQAKRSSPRT